MEMPPKIDSLELLRENVISCRKCQRLVKYREEISRRKVKRYIDRSYWGRPLPGFGDPDARVLIIGLAPAAHGGNRTGRMFTGDSSGDWLIRALYEVGFANQPLSIDVNDGLKLKDVYITAVVRCAPPKNRPLAIEIANCRPYLIEEIRLLKMLRVMVTLGKISFDNTLRTLNTLYPEFNYRAYRFAHGNIISDKAIPYRIFVSYHPSRQNTQTGRLTWGMWISIFRKVREAIG
jgi:uracil-DNA glycosylase family 4